MSAGNPHTSAGPVGPGASSIHDLVYNWPCYTANLSMSGRDAPVGVAVFTASKLLGHASSRFGWAFVRDAVVARRI